MTSLLLYAYSRGIYSLRWLERACEELVSIFCFSSYPSSRRIERACEERVDFMALTGGEKPDHSTICQFRSDHRDALTGLFVQVLGLCRDAGMVKLGHMALDGTRMKANASKHAAMSYARMKKLEPVLGQIKEARGFRQFLRKGLLNVAGEWALICAAVCSA